MYFLQTDRFTVEAVDLGRVYKMKIRHDNAMFSPDWFLDRVEVTDTADRDKYVFHCERWLGKKKDDGKLERSLYVKVYDKVMTLECFPHYWPLVRAIPRWLEAW